MTSVAVLMPTGITDVWRDQARAWVLRWYGQHFAELPICLGTVAGEWSKGAAVDAALAEAGSADVLILADADSFLHDPAHLAEALDVVRSGRSAWAIPHGNVYRLRQAETERLHADPAATPRLGHTCRPIYEGPAGGGITVVTRAAFEEVGGIDRRFLGWGGEDIAFGYALETLIGRPERIEGRLVHLWHPHPAPNLRGSPASEELVARYTAARGVRRRMAAIVAGGDWEPLPALPQPIRFRMNANRRTLRLASGPIVRFTGGIYETSDPDEVEQIRHHRIVTEETRR